MTTPHLSDEPSDTFYLHELTTTQIEELAKPLDRWRQRSDTVIVRELPRITKRIAKLYDLTLR